MIQFLSWLQSIAGESHIKFAAKANFLCCSHKKKTETVFILYSCSRRLLKQLPQQTSRKHEDSRLLACYAASLHKEIPTFDGLYCLHLLGQAVVFLDCLTVGEGTAVSQNIEISLPTDIAWHPRRLDLHHYKKFTSKSMFL